MGNTFNPYTQELMDEWHVELTRHIRGLIAKCSDYFIENEYESINVLDVGSNTGRFIELLNENIQIKEALLIDAIEELIEYSIHALDGIETHLMFQAVGLSDEDTTGSIYFSQIAEGVQPNLGTAKLYPDGHRDIPIRKFDTLWREDDLYTDFKPDLIKIDAEGYDIKVIQGMREFITHLDKKPMIVYELAGTNLSQDGKEEIWNDLKFLIDMGYEPYWHDTLTPQMSCDVALVVRPLGS